MLYYFQTIKGVFIIVIDIDLLLSSEFDKSDVNKAINLTNNLIMFNRQLREIEEKYSLELHHLTYNEMLEVINNLDQRLFELIEGKKGA